MIKFDPVFKMATIADYSISNLSSQAVPDEGHPINAHFLTKGNQDAIAQRLLNYVSNLRPNISIIENKQLFKMFLRALVTIGTHKGANFKNYSAQLGNTLFNYAEMVNLIEDYPGRYENITLRKFARAYAPFITFAIKNHNFPFEQTCFLAFEHNFCLPKGFDFLAFDFNFGIRPNQLNDQELLVLRATFAFKDEIDQKQSMLTSTSATAHKGMIKGFWNKVW
jgi:hypothetical protein